MLNIGAGQNEQKISGSAHQETCTHHAFLRATFCRSVHEFENEKVLVLASVTVGQDLE